MKLHLTVPFAIFTTLITAAAATGNPLLYMLALMTVFTVVLCLAGVLWASATMQISAECEQETVYRGDDVSVLLRVRHRGWIPIAPVSLEMSTLTGERKREIRLKNMPGKTQTLRMPLHAAHVGVFFTGIRSCTVEDLMGIFERKIIPRDTEYSLIVMPLTFDTEPLEMAPGDPGSEIMARATEDLSAPSDIRPYQPGDAMKKIHWKLSLRKGELMVRKFDEPVLQETLILMDCSKPPVLGHPEAEADLRDALLETAASLFSDQVKAENTVRMPLTGNHPVDLDDRMGLPIAFDYLTRLDFSAADRFEQALMMESRRLSKVGCVAVITARLNGSMTEMMIRMHRMGPNLRLYLVTFVPDDTGFIPFVGRLEHAGIEVEFITPDTQAGNEAAQ